MSEVCEDLERARERDKRLNDQLNRVVGVRSSEDSITWNIFGIFWAANAILLVALFSNGGIARLPVGIIVCCVGSVMALSAYLLQDRGLRFIEYYEATIENLERELKIEPKFAISGRVNETGYKEHFRCSVRARTVMRRMDVAALAGWFAFLMYFIVTAAS